MSSKDCWGSLSCKLSCLQADTNGAASGRLWPTKLFGKGILQPVELPRGCEVNSRFPTFVNCYSRWVGYWWYRRLWITSASIRSPLLMFLWITPIKLISSPRWTLVVSLFWNLSSLSRWLNSCSHLPNKIVTWHTPTPTAAWFTKANG